MSSTLNGFGGKGALGVVSNLRRCKTMQWTVQRRHLVPVGWIPPAQTPAAGQSILVQPPHWGKQQMSVVENGMDTTTSSNGKRWAQWVNGRSVDLNLNLNLNVSSNG
jgi:hypothetical protein